MSRCRMLSRMTGADDVEQSFKQAFTVRIRGSEACPVKLAEAVRTERLTFYEAGCDTR
jgi:hypothetical protein